MAKNPRLIDLSGQRFGLWSVVRQAGNTPRGGALWWSVCDCGTERAVLGADLRFGKSTNCGCVNRSRLGDATRTHGETHKSRLYQCWQNMKRRCAGDHPDYGGRGIRVCDEWRNFEAFRDWARSSGYRDDLTIERVDVNGNYEPANCTWADHTTQSQNRRFIKRAPDGRPWFQVARDNGIPSVTFNVRVAAGWSREEASTWPYGKLRKPRAKDPTTGKFTPKTA